MAQSLANLLLATIPGRPVGGRWTETPPSFEFVENLVMSSVVNKFLLVIAGKHIQVMDQGFDGVWSGLTTPRHRVCASSIRRRWSTSRRMSLW